MLMLTGGFVQVSPGTMKPAAVLCADISVLNSMKVHVGTSKLYDRIILTTLVYMNKSNFLRVYIYLHYVKTHFMFLKFTDVVQASVTIVFKFIDLSKHDHLSFNKSSYKDILVSSFKKMIM